MPFLRLLKPQPEVKPEVKPEIISEPEPQIIKPPENEVHEVNIEDVHEPENVNAPEEISGDSGTVIDSEGDSSNNVIQEEQQVSQEIEQPVEQVQEQEQEDESESKQEPESEAEIISETQEVKQDSQSSDNQKEQETDSEPESESKPESESENTITSEPQGQDITQNLGHEEPVTSETQEDSTNEQGQETTSGSTEGPKPFELQYDFTSGQRYVDLVSTKTEFDKMLDELANISKELLEHEAERFAKKYTGKFKAEDGKSESETDALKYEAFLGGYISNAAMLLYDKGYRDIAIKQLDQAKLKLEATKRLEEETAAIHARVEENNDSVDLSDILGMFGDG